MTRVLGSRLQPGAFFFSSKQKTKNKKPEAGSAVETATAVEIDKGRLRQYLLDDSHKLFGKAFAKTSSGFTTVPTAPPAVHSFSEEAITNKPPNTKFKLLPPRQSEGTTELSVSPAVRQGLSRGRSGVCLSAVPGQCRCRGSGWPDFRADRRIRSGTMAGRTG